MCLLPIRSAQNARLVVILALAALAILTTMADAADDPPAEPAPTTTEMSATTSSVPPTTTVTPSPSPSSVPPMVDSSGPTSSSTVPAPSAIDVVSVPAGADTSEAPAAPTPADPVLASACEPGVTAESSRPVTDDDAFFQDSFEVSSDTWNALSGSWTVSDGTYQQLDPSGYDLITQLRVELPDEYRITVSLRPLGEGLGGGLILAQPRLADRSGATVVDFTDGGSFLRWGRYDEATGQYQYLGGMAMADGFDPSSAHDLTVDVRRERTAVLVDGVDVGDFEAIGFGRVGLVTSRSAVAFDNLRVREVGA